MSGKKPVKKNRKSAASYAQELERRKELWTIKVLAYTQQEMLDAAALTLNEEFGFGEDRLKRFHEAFERKYAELRDLEHDDLPDYEYATAVQEEALRRAWDKYYTPRDERYQLHIVNEKGEELML